MIAVMGLGRSGLAVARAARRREEDVVVLDQKPAEALAKPEMLAQAQEEGIAVRTGWDGQTLPEGVTRLVVNPAVDMRHPLLAHARGRGVEVIGEIEYAYRIARAPIVAVTGSNGKSTTVVMAFLCLRACGLDAVLCGNVYGSGYPEVPLTEAADVAGPEAVLVAEVSSFQLEQVSTFRPVAAGITKIRPDHLDRYEGEAEYAATKHRIFSAQGPDEFAVVRAFDPEVHVPGAPQGDYRPRHLRAPEASEPTGPRVLTFGASGEHAGVDDVELRVLDKRLPVGELPFTEPHNFANAQQAALLAYAALLWIARQEPASRAAQILNEARAEYARTHPPKLYGPRVSAPDDILPGAILDGLRFFRGLAHRMEPVGERGGVRVVNNSMCTNPDAVLAGLQAARDPVHVLVGGVNKELDEADWRPLRHYLSNGRHHVYLYGRDRAQLARFLGDFPQFETLDQAFAAASRAVRSGQVLMLAPGCASTDQFRDFVHRGEAFRRLVQEWLDS